jgi:hypothetical protein
MRSIITCVFKSELVYYYKIKNEFKKIPLILPALYKHRSNPHVELLLYYESLAIFRPQAHVTNAVFAQARLSVRRLRVRSAQGLLSSLLALFYATWRIAYANVT